VRALRSWRFRVGEHVSLPLGVVPWIAERARADGRGTWQAWYHPGEDATYVVTNEGIRGEVRVYFGRRLPPAAV
jgi:hypothetical protein